MTTKQLADRLIEIGRKINASCTASNPAFAEATISAPAISLPEGVDILSLSFETANGGVRWRVTHDVGLFIEAIKT